MNRHHAKKFCVKVFKKLKRRRNSIPKYQYDEVIHQLHICKEQIPKSGKSYKKEIDKLQALDKRVLPVSHVVRTIEWLAGLAGALILALILRSMLLEPYKIPSGSMRPTLKEKDLMIVNKTHFGINIPFVNKHFLFSDELVNRMGITIFSGFGLDLPNNYMMYFFIFPGIKQYIKRVMAKPEDWVYFYGGKLWAVDKYGHDVRELRDSATAKALTWVPYIYRDGKKKVFEFSKGKPEVGFFQMNIPILKAWVNSDGYVLSEFFNGNCWSMNFIQNFDGERKYPTQYRDLWGLGNYATVRLIDRVEKEDLYNENRIDFQHVLYMEIFSLPSITSEAWAVKGGQVQGLRPNRSFIPLNQEHVSKLMQHMYTNRFVVSNGRAYRYDLLSKGGYRSSNYGIDMPSLPDGTYEFEDGVCYEIRWSGDREKLPNFHAVYSPDPKHVMNLFNFGMNFDERFMHTSRYTYYNEGDLYVLGKSLFAKNDPYLEAYVKDQIRLENTKKQDSSFYPFIDMGPPVKEGKVDIEFIKAFGLKVPKKRYMLLGDNYASSADSREFGFVQEGNLRGSASLIFWPFSSFGFPLQPSNFWFTYPKIIVWMIAILAFFTFYYVQRSRLKRDFDSIQGFK